MPAIIILGGHRSGTSVTARLIHELGFPAAPSPRRLLRPQPGRERDNPDGYFEDIAFVRLHRRMLGEHVQSLGGWRNPRRDDAVLARSRSRYRELLRERAEAGPCWSLKDPRLCLLGDLLFAALAELEIASRVVTTVRPLSEVVGSLTRRGLCEADAQRLAEVFEAGRVGMQQLAASLGIPCLEVSLASAKTGSEVEAQVSRLQQFLGRENAPIAAAELADLVRVGRGGRGPNKVTEKAR